MWLHRNRVAFLGYINDFFPSYLFGKTGREGAGMHFSDCIFLTPYKEHLLHCGAANQFLKYRDVCREWACGGCPIPRTMSQHFCIYLAPKRYLDHSGSFTEWFCSLSSNRLVSPVSCDRCDQYTGILLGPRLVNRSERPAAWCTQATT